ncbi:hypothetical protein GSN00_00145 [Cylindrospermopsis raciborskii CHAB3438]|uniref:EpsG family protein n=1 Tax=Cylindrospermopsis raciborskii TaxID=77022 RepID=UPI001F100BBD|nr:EpsG family protein [Cylindrospermopsis raciborskii]MCH4902846.1 hypothetical protein [Cylindrospermopsis raciborskii CHAB3438]
MNEITSIFAAAYFSFLVYVFILVNVIRLQGTAKTIWLFLPYVIFSIFLGLRNIYPDSTLDPKIFYDQAKELSIGELLLQQFPKVDVAVQLLMKLYLAIFDSDVLTLIFTHLTILSLFFLGVSLLFNSNHNALLLVVAFLAFTNTGILLSANFLRQGLASAVFIFSVYTHISSNNKRIHNYFSSATFGLLQILQFFAHISSISLPVFLLASDYLKKENLKKENLIRQIMLVLIFSVPVLLFFSTTIFSQFIVGSNPYGGYVDVTFEGAEDRLFLKLLADLVIAILMLTIKFLFKLTSSIFNLAMRICIFIGLVCIYYSSNSIVVALRMEYYLNFLLIIALSALISTPVKSNYPSGTIALIAIICMYIYSFVVYNHPSVTRILVF